MTRPRRTLRRQLTLMYAGPFLVSGAILLLIPLLGASQSQPADPDAGPRQPPPVRVDAPGVSHSLLSLSAVSLAVMVVVAFGLGWIIAGRFLRPLRLIIDTARDISATNLHRRLGPTGRRDEFAELAGTLDELFGRLEASFAAQRRFVANASHELRTPLTAQRALLQVTLSDPDASAQELRTAAREVLALGESQARLIDSLLTLAVGEQGVQRPVALDLAPLARRVLDTRAARTDVSITARLDPAALRGDQDLVESLIANLVDNAVKHNVPGGTVTVSTGVTDGRAALTVSNTGPVVPPEDLDRLFQPFQRLGAQRVRTTSDGYGLGLAIVRAIATAHNAALTATPAPDGGLSVTVAFARA
ncbi:sensor histidine kinase [Dactylosporangium sp. CA-233914]|uniref:sensor histidine kinase n=1 Tax=Dactylosporangium sp. CA-233914 TaxID=3239934 RepID=UPI003D8C39A4